MGRLTPILLIGGFAMYGWAKPKEVVFVRVISNVSHTSERTYTYTPPAYYCVGCNTPGTPVQPPAPAQPYKATTSTLYVESIVEPLGPGGHTPSGMQYKIVCTSDSGFCATLNDGDTFPSNSGDAFSAEIEGTTMWIEMRLGGNQGKKVRVKYRILDIRPLESR